jgi:membrane-bound lytic murein transglycosylase D
MSLVEKIPPLISALAFGYGVGMAAPEGALDKMQAAIVENVRQKPAPRVAARAPAEVPPVEKRLPGDESDALAELRAAHAPSRYVDANESHLPGLPYRRPKAYRGDISTSGEFDEIEEEFDASETAAISRLQLPDLGLPVTRQALKYVRFFTKTDRGRDLFATWLKRSGRYQELIEEQFRERNLPLDLMWVAMIESGFDPTAKSPAGAVGLWQFMPTTGADYGLRQNHFVDQRKNPRLATQAAAHHLRDLYTRFGQWDLALAAYNMGYEQLLDRIDEVGSTDFTELVRQHALPTETAKYVPKIVAAAIVANNLERFGFDDVKLQQSVDGGQVSVPPRTSIVTLARAAGVSTSVIRKLNPDLLGKEIPPGKGDFLVTVPAETLSQTVAALPGLVRNQRDAADANTDLMDPFDLMNPEGFRPSGADDDENLLALLPKPKSKSSRRRSMRDPAIDGVARDAADDLAADDDPAPRERKGRETVIYRIGEGDTLIGIAKQFAMDVDDVARDNHLRPNEQLREGGLLRLRVKKDILEMDARKEGRSDARPAKRPARDG